MSSTESYYPTNQGYPPYLMTNKKFQEALPSYQKVFITNKHTITNNHPNSDNNSANINETKRNKKQEIESFNPPFNLKMKTKIGKSFLNLLNISNFFLITNDIDFLTRPMWLVIAVCLIWIPTLTYTIKKF